VELHIVLLAVSLTSRLHASVSCTEKHCPGPEAQAPLLAQTPKPCVGSKDMHLNVTASRHHSVGDFTPFPYQGLDLQWQHDGIG
jgi:hypothetical protein